MPSITWALGGGAGCLVDMPTKVPAHMGKKEDNRQVSKYMNRIAPGTVV